MSLPGFVNGGGVTRFAAFSVLDSTTSSSLVATYGAVHKHPSNPLFTGTREWEHDINNGYSSILHDAHDSLGLGSYRVYYSAGDPSFGGAIPGESSGSATLYATSPDGIHFTKPALHRYAFRNDTANNILFDGTTAVAIYDDGFHEPNASRRFKAWGNLPGLERDQLLGGYRYTAQLAGSAVSANGLDFTDYRRLQDPSSSVAVKDTLRFDAQTSLFFDDEAGRYVGTMRAFRPCAACGDCPIWWQPHGGCQARLSRSCTAVQCNQTVRAIGASVSSSAEFETAKWGRNLEVHSNRGDPTRQFYSQVSWPYYNGYLGIVMVFSAVDPPNVFGRGKVHCELAWSTDGSRYERVLPGVDFIPLGSVERHDFDSHICFASAHPVKLRNETRVYYMAGDGPHYSPPYPSALHRNSSYALATIRPDGFVGVAPLLHAGDGSATTVPLAVSGDTLILTADAAPAGAVAVTVLSSRLPGGSALCATLSGRNVTDEPVGGCDLAPVVGHEARLQLRVTAGATLYTVGFRSSQLREA